jgi:hypothetical protein
MKYVDIIIHLMKIWIGLKSSHQCENYGKLSEKQLYNLIVKDVHPYEFPFPSKVHGIYDIFGKYLFIFWKRDES